MAEHNTLGTKGEDLACEYLVKNGYRLLERNWKFIKDEIDIIAEKQNELVFVEVKTRSSDEWQAAELAVTSRKQRNLINAAEAYIFKNNIEHESRFDIIAIYIKNEGPEVIHIEQAFYPQRN